MMDLSGTMIKALKEIAATGYTTAGYRTRMALYNRGLIQFRGGDDTLPELTSKGIEATQPSK